MIRSVTKLSSQADTGEVSIYVAAYIVAEHRLSPDGTYCHRRQYLQGFTAHIVAHRHWRSETGNRTYGRSETGNCTYWCSETGYRTYW